MSEYTAKVGLDIHDYESGIQRLTKSVSRFTEETKKLNIAQSQISPITNRASNQLKDYTEKQVKLKEKLQEIQPQLRRLNKLEKERAALVAAGVKESDRAYTQLTLKIANLNKELGSAPDRVKKLKAELAETAKTLMPKQTKTLGFLGEIAPKVDTALKALDKFQQKYKHLQSLADIRKSIDLTPLRELGVDSKEIERTTQQYDRLFKMLANAYGEPAYQRALDTQRLLQRGEKAINEVLKERDQIMSRPMLRGQQEIIALQSRLNDGLAKEKELRETLAGKVLGPKRLGEFQAGLKARGDEVYRTLRELEEAANKVHATRSAGLIGALGEAHKSPNFDLALRAELARRQVEVEAQKLPDQDIEALIRDLTGKHNPELVSQRTMEFPGLASALRNLDEINKQYLKIEADKAEAQQKELKRLAELREQEERILAARKQAAELSKNARPVEDIRVGSQWDRDGGGSTPDQKNVDYFGFTGYLSPKDFINLNPSGSTSDPREMAKAMEAGTKFAETMLSVRWDDVQKAWHVVGHEGRTRANASQMLGDSMIPVSVLPQGGLRAKDITDEMRNAPIHASRYADDQSYSTFLRMRNDPHERELLGLERSFQLEAERVAAAKGSPQIEEIISKITGGSLGESVEASQEYSKLASLYDQILAKKQEIKELQEEKIRKEREELELANRRLQAEELIAKLRQDLGKYDIDRDRGIRMAQDQQAFIAEVERLGGAKNVASPNEIIERLNSPDLDVVAKAKEEYSHFADLYERNVQNVTREEESVKRQTEEKRKQEELERRRVQFIKEAYDYTATLKPNNRELTESEATKLAHLRREMGDYAFKVASDEKVTSFTALLEELRKEDDAASHQFRSRYREGVTHLERAVRLQKELGSTLEGKKLSTSDIVNEPYMQNMVKGDHSPGQLTSIIKAQHDLARALLNTNMNAKQYANTMEEIKKGNRQVITNNIEVADAYKRVQLAINQTDHSSQKLMLSWGSIGRLTFARGLTHVFYGLTTQIWQSWSAAQELSKAISEIQTLAQQAPMDASIWRKEALSLSSDWGFDIADVTGSIYETLSNQVAGNMDAIVFNRVVAPFALTTRSTMEDSMNLISSAINAFGKEARDANEIAAQFFTTIDLGRVRADDMADTYGRVATFARQARVSMEELNGMIAHLTISGLRFERASTFIINVLNKLAKPTPAMERFLKGRLGVDSGEAAIAVHGLPGILDAILMDTSGSLDELGVMARDIRAMIGYSGLMRDIDNLHGAIRQIGDESMPSYERAVRYSMESSGFIVGREMNKMRNNFVATLEALLDLLAGFQRFATDMNKAGHLIPNLSQLMTGASVAAMFLGGGGLGQFGRFAAGRSSGIGGRNEIKAYPRAVAERVLEARRSSGNIDKLYNGDTHSGTPDFSAGIIDLLVAQTYLKTSSFLEKGAVNKSIIRTITNSLGITSATKMIAGIVLANLPLIAIALMGAIAIPMVARQASSWLARTTASSRGRTRPDGLDSDPAVTTEVLRAIQTQRRASQRANREIASVLTRHFQELLDIQSKVLNEYNENVKQVHEKISSTHQGRGAILGSLSGFQSNYLRQTLSLQNNMMENPLAKMDNTRGYMDYMLRSGYQIFDRDQQMGAQLIQEWLNTAGQLRSDAYGFQRENPQALNVIGQVENYIGSTMAQIMAALEVEATGNQLIDMYNLRQKIDQETSFYNNFEELKKTIDKSVSEGLNNWTDLIREVKMLPLKLQQVFALTYGSPGELQSSLLSVLAQQNLKDLTQAEQRKIINASTQGDMVASTQQEIVEQFRMTEGSPMYRLFESYFALTGFDNSIGPQYEEDVKTFKELQAKVLEQRGAATPEFTDELFKFILGVRSRVSAAIQANEGSNSILGGIGQAKIFTEAAASVPLTDQFATNIRALGRYMRAVAEGDTELANQLSEVMAQTENVKDKKDALAGLLASSVKEPDEITIASRIRRSGPSEEVYGLYSQFLQGHRAGTLHPREYEAFGLEGKAVIDQFVTGLETALKMMDTKIYAWQQLGVPAYQLQPRHRTGPMPGDQMFEGWQHRAGGGMIDGPRGTDTVPAWLTPGEFVVKRDMAQKHGHLLQKLNAGYYSRGGFIEINGEKIDFEDFKKQRQQRMLSQWFERNWGGSSRFKGIEGAGDFNKFVANRDRVRFGPPQNQYAVGADYITDDGLSVDERYKIRQAARDAEWKKFNRSRFAPQMEELREEGKGLKRSIARRNLATNLAAGTLVAAALLPPLLVGGKALMGVRAAQVAAKAAGMAAKRVAPWDLPYRPGIPPHLQLGYGAKSTMASRAAQLFKGASRKKATAPWDMSYDPSTIPLAFADGGWVTQGRARSFRPNLLAGGGFVGGGNTTVNATINLSGSGMAETDARRIIREIKRETARGGMAVS